MKIRKQVYELKPHDLQDVAVWEFALDEEGEEGQDEATVRPVQSAGALDPSDGMYIVRASFTLADGSQASGYLTPGVQGDESLGSVQPAVVTDTGQVSFWCGIIAPSRQHLDGCYKLLGKLPEHVFPLSFRSDVPLLGGQIEGTIPGFVVLKDMKSRKTSVIQ